MTRTPVIAAFGMLTCDSVWLFDGPLPDECPAVDIAVVPSLTPIEDALAHHGASLLGQFAGHTIANCLSAMAATLNCSSSLWFAAGNRPDPRSAGHLFAGDSLRRSGIDVVLPAAGNTQHETITVITGSDGRTRALFIEDLGSPTYPVLPKAADICVIGAWDLVGSQRDHVVAAAAGSRIAMLLGDLPYEPNRLADALDDLMKSAHLEWLIGSSSSIGAEAFSDFPFNERILTSGTEDVHVWGGPDEECLTLRVDPAAFVVTDLGAGDAYAGAYVARRLDGAEPSAAHTAAMQYAQRVVGHVSARVDEHVLHRRARAVLDPDSDTVACADDLFKLVRDSPDLVVVSGGQTGVDSLGIEAASDYGCPAYALMPKGHRSETGGVPDEIQATRARVLTTPSPSYRPRTWVNAAISDGTLLFDWADTEGCAETRRACAVLGRPLFEGINATTHFVDELRQWAESHAIRVLNVAGCRGSSLTEESRVATARLLDLAMRTLCPPFTTGIPISVTGSSDRPPAQLTIGVSKHQRVRELWETFLRDSFGAESFSNPDRLVNDFPSLGLRVLFLRSRDVAGALRDGLVDGGVTWHNQIVEERADAAVPLVDTGWFANHMGMLTVAGASERPQDVVTEFPTVAERLLGEGIAIRTVSGGAEGWVASGLASACLDTYSTGRTAAAHGLRFADIGLRSAITLFAASARYDHVAPLAERFRHWQFTGTPSH